MASVIALVSASHMFPSSLVDVVCDWEPSQPRRTYETPATWGPVKSNELQTLIWPSQIFPRSVYSFFLSSVVFIDMSASPFFERSVQVSSIQVFIKFIRKIRTPNGTFHTLYGHLQFFRLKHHSVCAFRIYHKSKTFFETLSLKEMGLVIVSAWQPSADIHSWESGF